MKLLNRHIFFAALIFLTFSCGEEDKDEESSWSRVKNNAYVEVFLTSEYGTPSKLNIDTMGWEDGLSVSRDGLHLYATYIPADFLSYVLHGDTVDKLQYYDRGPHYDMDFVTNPVGATYPWIQSDIVYASRASISDNFSSWYTSGVKRSIYSEGALMAVFSSSTTVDILVFTSNEEYTARNNLKIIGNTTANPTGIGTFITSTDTTGTTSINTNYDEDNPHLERIGANNIVLFFDSKDRPGGSGNIDIWYSETADNGVSWSTPINVTTVNTSGTENQPHLYNDGIDWWLYYSAYHTDGKLGIFRAKRTGGGWDSWGAPEIVLGAGNTAGIGEPSLASNGDLFFITVYENPDGTDYDRYDGDAWVVLKK